MSTTKHELLTLKGYDTTVPLAPNSPRVGTLCRPFPQATPTRPKDYLGQSSPALASYRDTHQPCTPFSLPQPIPRFTPNPARNPQPRPIASLSLFWPAKDSKKPRWLGAGRLRKPGLWNQVPPIGRGPPNSGGAVKVALRDLSTSSASQQLPSINRKKPLRITLHHRESTQSRRKLSKLFSSANSAYWNQVAPIGERGGLSLPIPQAYPQQTNHHSLDHQAQTFGFPPTG